VEEKTIKAVEEPSIEAMDNTSLTVEFIQQRVAVSDLATVSSATNTVSFIDCSLS
jgi:hypothetical protein